MSPSLDAGTNSTLKGTVWTLAGGYSLLESHSGALELINGFRYLGLDASTNWNLTATISAPNAWQTPQTASRAPRRAPV